VRTPSLVISKTEEGYPFEEFIYCGCGCQHTRTKYNWVKKETKFINGHENRGKIMSEKQKKMISESLKGTRLGELNPAWKGDEVGLNALHLFIRSRLPEPKLCQMCNQVPPYDLANISGKYLRDLDDWLYLCRSCHKIFDIRYKSPVDRQIFIDNLLTEG
jgi:uncharacterized protein YlaI